MFSHVVRARLIDGLEGTPDLLDYLLETIPAGDPRWSANPDSSPYTLGEILAHLADWDVIWLERLKLTANAFEPLLVAVDIYKRASECDYAHVDPKASLASLAESRPKLINLLRSLSDASWKRIGTHPEEGRQSIETQCAWILAHDDYYVKQTVRLLRLLK